MIINDWFFCYKIITTIHSIQAISLKNYRK